MNALHKLSGEALYERIRDEIISCQLEPGARLDETALARRLPAATSPLRLVLKRLGEDGLVETRPSEQHQRVARISLADAHDLYALRALLEQGCIRAAVENASDEELAGLQRYRVLGGDTDPHTWCKYNRRFHLTLAALSGNMRLASMAREAIDECQRLVHFGNSPHESWQQSLAEHAAIIDAVVARDGALGADLMARHIQDAEKRLAERAPHPALTS